MKRIVALALSMLMLLSVAALAEDSLVVNCKEWVSLREAPDTAAKRLRQVPLGAVVTDCEPADEGSGFVRCTYDGATGYILEEYLEALSSDGPKTVLEATVDGVALRATRGYVEGETLTVEAEDASGALLWSFVTETGEVGELDATSAFIGGTADDPRVMVYNAQKGLYSLDPATGEEVWLLDADEARLGAGIAHAVDADGTMYISGYYGPDPVCIDVDGNVKWRAASGSDEIYWPYEIAIEDRGIVTRYSMMDGNGREGRVIYDAADGHVVDVEYDK